MPSANLPIEYQEVEYLESTGTQWIDTGVVPHIGCELSCRFMLTGTYTTNGHYETIFCSGTGAENSSYITLTYGLDGNGYSNYYGYFHKGAANHTFNAPIHGSWHDLSFASDGTLTISNAFTASNTPVEEISGTHQNLIVFANALAQNKANCRISSFTLSENDAQVLNLIPCYRKSDHVAGMYDTVSESFLTNQGTGEFLVGPDVILLPPGYRRVEWLESSGKQYLNVGIVPTIDTSIELVKGPTVGDYTYVLLGVGASAANQYTISNNSINFVSKRDVGFYSVRNAGTIAIRHKVVYRNGVQALDLSDAEGQPANFTLTLWCRHWGNQQSEFFDRKIAGKFYSFRMWDENDNCIADLVPCYRISDEKPGMYDLARNVFLTNQGTGEFITSRAIYPSHERVTAALEMAWRRRALVSKLNRWLPPEYQRVEYLESTGTQWIDTGINASNDLTVSATFSLDQRALSNDRNYVFGCNAENVSRTQYSYSKNGLTGWGGAYYGSRGITNTNKHIIIADKNGFTLDNTVEYVPRSSDFSITINIWLFALNRGNGLIDFPSDGMRIYSALISENDARVLNLIPCYRKQDNKPGMYDLVTKQFFVNQGTGEFVLGPDV